MKRTDLRDHFPGLRRLGRGPLAAACLLAFFGMGCLAWVAVSLADAALVEAREGAELERAREEMAIEAPLEVGPRAWPELSEGDLVGRIEIERLGISAVVLEGVRARTLRRAVGRIPGTGLPGLPGNVGLAGHRDSFFRELSDAAEGDVVRLLTPQGTFTYRVDRVVIVDPEDVHVLDNPAGDGEVLTLVSCYPFYYVGPAPRRFIVQATRSDGT